MPARPKKTNPSMLDVANHAGVSIATVSNVINRPEMVASATAIKVRRSIDALGFVRNAAARSLAVGSTNGLGLILADLENSLFVDMAHGAQQAAKAAGKSLLLGNSVCSPVQQDEYLNIFDEARVGGILLAPMEDSLSGVERLRSHGRQIVVLNYAHEEGVCCTVLVDNEKVGYLAARHLIDSGRTRLAFVAGRDFYQPVHDRRLGVRRAVAETRGRAALEEVDTHGLLHRDGMDIADTLLSRDLDDMPDGIVAVTDAIANGISQALTDDGRVSVPFDLGIVGCEDNRSAESGPLPLTVVNLRGVEMGEVATELLLEEISSIGGRHRHRTVVLEPTLIVRSSSVPTADPDRGGTVDERHHADTVVTLLV